MDDLEDVLARARAGDTDAMAGLYRAFAGPVLSFLMTHTRSRQDAEDVLGEVFLSAMRDISSFEGEASGFRAWLYRIATNRAIDLARRQRRRPEAPIEEAAEQPAAEDPAREALGREERARLWRAVDGLPEQQRRVVTLRLAAGLSSAEIARVLGKRVGAVKALQHRALTGLARALGAYPAEDSGRFEP